MSSCQLVSVIIPIYNSEKYLKECLDSVLNQTYDNLEIILINDASPDSSDLICEEYCKKDKRVFYKCLKSNSGVSAARNMGLDVSTGEYIVFLDSDDYIMQDFIMNAVNKIKDIDSVLYIGGFTLFDKNGERVFRQKQEKHYTGKELLSSIGKDYHSEWIGIIGSKVYKKSIIEKNRLKFDNSLDFGEDACFNFEYISHVETIVFDNNSSYYYRVTGNSSLGSKFRENIYDIHKRVFSLKADVMRKLGCDQEIINAYCAETFALDIIKIYEKNSTISHSRKLSIIRKVSNDDNIKSVRLKRIKKKKIRLIVLLLKIHLIFLIDIILQVNSRIR